MDTLGAQILNNSESGACTVFWRAIIHGLATMYFLSLTVNEYDIYHIGHLISAHLPGSTGTSRPL